MSTDTADQPTVMHADGATVEIQYVDDVALVQIDSAATGASARRAGDLACAALREARRHRARYVRTALQMSRPSCAIVLDALRRRVGTDASDVELRRAGSSVMVTVPLLP
ncbi:hypothetical protein Q9R32_17090 [Actinotalea sp. AC32]|nr:hypothetical protein [Actinotalea sp. AC32]